MSARFVSYSRTIKSTSVGAVLAAVLAAVAGIPGLIVAATIGLMSAARWLRHGLDAHDARRARRIYRAAQVESDAARAGWDARWASWGGRIPELERKRTRR